MPAGLTPFNPVRAVAVQEGKPNGYILEALDGGRPAAGVTATVRLMLRDAVEYGPDRVVLVDAAARRAFAGAAARRIDSALTAGAPSVDDLERALVRLHAEVESQLRATGTPGQGGGQGGTGGAGGHPYTIGPNGEMMVIKQSRGGPFQLQIANFHAKIEAEHLLDDGQNDPQLELEITGVLAGSPPRALPPVRIHGNKFAGMLWPIVHWGSEAIVGAEGGAREHCRAAIQFFSGQPPRRVAYVHAGWRQVAPYGWVFLHGGGAIGAQGALPEGAVSVELHGALAPLVLPPPPPEGDVRLVEGVHYVLGLFKLVRQRRDRRLITALLGAAFRAPLAVLSVPDLAVFVVGPTGVFKSELTALMQSFFGAGFTRKTLPGEWSATSNMLERVLFDGKDSLVTIDDFAPTASASGMLALRQTAGRIIRNVGNVSARGRMGPDLNLRPTFRPRGLLLSSGEDLPGGATASVMARLFALTLSPGTIDPAELTTAQEHAREGEYALAMAGFLRWLAGRLEGLKKTFATDLATLRDKAAGSASHRRTPEAVSNLLLGWRTYLEYALDVGALTRDEARARYQEAWAALGELAEEQAAALIEQDTLVRFADAVVGAITTGRAHLANEDDSWPSPDDAARRWGWEYVPAIGHAPATWKPRGERIGWTEGDDVFLDSTVILATVETHLRRTDQTLGVSAPTLHKRLHERGKLVSTEEWGGKRRLTVRRTFAGERRSVLHLSGAWLFDPRSSPEREPPPGGEGMPQNVRQVRQWSQSAAPGTAPQEGPGPETPSVAHQNGAPHAPPRPECASEVRQEGGSPQGEGAPAGAPGALGAPVGAYPPSPAANGSPPDVAAPVGVWEIDPDLPVDRLAEALDWPRLGRGQQPAVGPGEDAWRAFLAGAGPDAKRDARGRLGAHLAALRHEERQRGAIPGREEVR